VAVGRWEFIITQTERILAIDGEMVVQMSNGVTYQIPFGDVAPIRSTPANRATTATSS
jgi:uncharacterized cupin superfamily protein